MEEDDTAAIKGTVLPVPEGCLINAASLTARGITRSRLNNWLRSGELVAAARGAYRRPGPPLKWQAVVYSLQNMGYDFTLGGLSALELHGLNRYLNLGAKPVIHLYGDGRPPAWLHHVPTQEEATFRIHPALIEKARLPSSAVVSMPWGMWDWPLRVSSSELAALETLKDVPNGVSFTYADELLQGLVGAKPKLTSELLHTCENVKVKRLFLWLAERNDAHWLKYLIPESIDLGKGKRTLAKGGRFDKKYMITVPEELYGRK